MSSQAGYEFIIQSLESGCKDMAIKCQVLYGKASEFYDKDPVVTASIQDMQLFIRTIVKYRFPPPKKKEAGSFELASLFIVQFILQD